MSDQYSVLGKAPGIDELKNHLSEDLNLSKLDKLLQVIIKCAVFEFLYKYHE